ncbi:glmZ(sRNA)-inactivating NTPase [Piscirickettsia salmonis]|uniref:RapZ n=1 Tax=Piscirickettsia salmonis TaxID=1238 RepID=A0A1L6TDS8_PISSA|nr:RNase adapter RapZ [Piscirickettsia salmonis]AKP74602.1 glmZ(sRNA)-inactivating NTPase [Piscirickettsia salmonis LF-89 = ATCC VR-1361]ALB23604.1 RapZ [Piscirickettsia salmonis]ALY03469.1 RNase adaptor protein RapZ [Piscirickettsia salmonis]AMA43034.1 RNase adaptor protein RapZ [Piscirickettsia salmonis]AOS35503.1 glmZ(sRNA)-inactivating NTPase [Piscirickettsia salmonis]
MKLIIVSGRSGAGKTVCSHILEDLGFRCIDNLPITMLEQLATNMKTTQNTATAVSIDVRNQLDQLKHFEDILNKIRQNAIDVEVIYLDAHDESLLRRFSETRRRHPLSTNTGLSLADALQQETILLEPLSRCADLTVDTSEFNLHQLRDFMRQRLGQSSNNSTLSVLIQSFGFKYGAPKDSDFIFDVRCLSNPYWMPHLRDYTGKDPIIIDYLDQQDDVQHMLGDLKRFINTWLEPFSLNNRSYLTISIGCTGGMHRSVYLVEKLVSQINSTYCNLQHRHRELL